MKTRTYYLISTTNPQVEGWSIFGQGTKSELHRDIYAQTLNKNSRIVSKTVAKRVYKLDV